MLKSLPTVIWEIFNAKIFSWVATLDPRKLIELKINHMNIFHIQIYGITLLSSAQKVTHYAQ